MPRGNSSNCPAPTTTVKDGSFRRDAILFDDVIEMADTPAEHRGYPIETLVGSKKHPTLHVHYGDCTACPVCEWCREDVLSGDFAWCEDLADVDFQPN